MAEIYDLVIIGSGPAGLAAAIYAQRAKLDTLVLEKEMMSGGQVLTTYEVDNYPGIPGIGGFELGMQFRQHADRLGAVFVQDEVQKIRLARESEEESLKAAELSPEEGSGAEGASLETDAESPSLEADAEGASLETDAESASPEADAEGASPETDAEGPSPETDAEGILSLAGRSRSRQEPLLKKVCGKNDTYLTRSVIIATGARHRKLGVPGEETLAGRGVSYCATCDGAFFKNKVTAVVGGGDVALEDAIFLSRMCRQVYLIHRRDALRGAKSLQEKVFSQENITVVWDTVVEEICGTEKTESLKLLNKKTGQKSQLPVDGVFIAVGITPNSQAYEGLVAMEQGYIQADETGATSVEGIFAAGDVRTKQLRQIITAAADGAAAVTSVEQYLAGF